MDLLKNIAKKTEEMWCRLDRKTRRYMALIGVGAIFLQGVDVLKNANGLELTKEDLRLPEYGQEVVEFPVDIHYEDGRGSMNYFSTIIQLKPKTYSEEEAQLVLDKVCGRLKDIILGSNSSLAEVHSNLELVKTISGVPVDISWYSTDYEVVDSVGNVNNSGFDESERKEVVLYALVNCGEYSREQAIVVTVVSRIMSEDEYLIAGINKAIDLAMKECADGSAVLPQSYNGGTLTYYKKKESQGSTYLILGIIAVVAVVIGDSKQKKALVQERKKQLSFDYSEVISKITLLMGAGMTMQRAWERIVIDYRSRKDTGKKRYVYEEMSESYNQMKAGVPEAEVYEQFGRRCDLKEYQKFSALIVQNIKKGTKDIAALLELEAIEAFEKRKNLARVKGEEAGTKLLIPMVIMLVVVMAVIMVPALITFEM